MADSLKWVAATTRPDLLAEPVVATLAVLDPAGAVQVAEIDPDLADTAAFCETYGVSLDISANCVVVGAKRAGERRLAACMVLATTRADINGMVRRHLDARKVSFAPMDQAVSETGMEYGGITPIGLPADWPVLVDGRCVVPDRVIVGSGVRRSKLLIPSELLAAPPNAEVLEGMAQPLG